MGAITRSLANALVNVDTNTQKLSSDGLDVDLTNLSGTNITSGTVANARLVNSGQFTINGSSVALGGSTTISTITRPTISTTSAAITPSSSQTFTLAGANFQSIPIVELISSTGAITRASAVTFNSSSSF